LTLQDYRLSVRRKYFREKKATSVWISMPLLLFQKCSIWGDNHQGRSKGKQQRRRREVRSKEKRREAKEEANREIKSGHLGFSSLN
jgi:hypothetical protein